MSERAKIILASFITGVICTLLGAEKNRILRLFDDEGVEQVMAELVDQGDLEDAYDAVRLMTLHGFSKEQAMTALGQKPLDGSAEAQYVYSMEQAGLILWKFRKGPEEEATPETPLQHDGE